jgi:hypothetical protein
MDTPLETPEGYTAAVDKDKTMARNQLAHDVRNQNLAWPGTRTDTKSGMNSHPK